MPTPPEVAVAPGDDVPAAVEAPLALEGPALEVPPPLP